MVISGFADTHHADQELLPRPDQPAVRGDSPGQGPDEKGSVLYGHVFRNAMLIVIAGFPSAFIGILFTGSLLIEVIFSLDGLGQARISKRHHQPRLSGHLRRPSSSSRLLGLLFNFISDLTYTLVDPRIDFERREA